MDRIQQELHRNQKQTWVHLCCPSSIKARNGWFVYTARNFISMYASRFHPTISGCFWVFLDFRPFPARIGHSGVLSTYNFIQYPSMTSLGSIFSVIIAHIWLFFYASGYFWPFPVVFGYFGVILPDGVIIPLWRSRIPFNDMTGHLSVTSPRSIISHFFLNLLR